MASLIDVLRSIRRRAKGPLACPVCGEIVRRSRQPLEGWILPVRYMCGKCGYSGFLAMEEAESNQAAGNP